MKAETRAKIQEAISLAIMWIPDDDCEDMDKLNAAREALAAEPDEPTVSKPVEEERTCETCFYENKPGNGLSACLGCDSHNGNWKPRAERKEP